MELLSPAGDLEKLATVYRFGADAAYIGLAGFSLRQRAHDLDADAHATYAGDLARIKGDKKLYGALNIYFHEDDLKRLEAQIDAIAALPLDAIIVSDIGAVPILRRRLPGTELHLSTQANCLNSSAARLYQELGFSRIIPAREMSLDDLRTMKDLLPGLEVEVFVHGAMCLAYSGRCLLSAWESGRSGNKGDCSHSCRWNYKHYVEEERHPGEFMEVDQSAGHTTLLSSRDLCMIEHVEALRDAGMDALKIEGRMKSSYYAAITARAYRKEIDRVVSSGDRAQVEGFLDELYNVSHREFSTGFYFGEPNEVAPTKSSYTQAYRYMGRIGRQVAPSTFELHVKNSFSTADEIEYITPDAPQIPDSSFALLSGDGAAVERVSHQEGGLIHTSAAIAEGDLIRRRKTPTT